MQRKAKYLIVFSTITALTFLLGGVLAQECFPPSDPKPVFVCAFGLAGIGFLFVSLSLLLKNRRSISKHISKQLCFVSFFIALFWDIASVSAYTDKTDLYSILFMALGLVIFNACFITFAVLSCAGGEPADNRKNLPGAVRYNPYLYLVALLYISLQLIDISVNPIFDSAIYFTELSKIARSFNFLPVGSFINLQVMNHCSGAAGAYYLLGQFLFPYNNMIMNIQTMLITTAGLFAFEKILRFFHSDDKYKLHRAIGTAIFIFSPTVFGSTLQITVDLLTGLFMVFLIYAILYDRKILTVFFGICLIYSKTPAIVLYLGIGLGLLLFKIPSYMNKDDKPFKSYMKCCLDNWHYLIPCFSFFVWWFAMRNQIWGNNTPGSIVSKMGLSKSALYENVMHIFAINFYWLFYIFVFIALALAIKRCGKITDWIKNEKASGILVLVTAFIAFFGYSCMFQDGFRHPRYVIPLFMLSALFVFLAVQYVIKNRYVNIGILSAILVLSIACCYKTFDPVFLAAFPHIKNENQTLSFYEVTSPFPEDTVITDITLYNREYVYIDKLYVDFLNRVDFSEDDVAIFLDCSLWNVQFSGNPGVVSYIRTGNGRRLYDYSPDEELKAVSIKQSDFEAYEPLPDEAFFMRLWFQEERLLDVINTRYDVVEYIPIQRGNYHLHAYRVKLK